MNITERLHQHVCDSSLDLLAFFHGLKKREQQSLKNELKILFNQTQQTDKLEQIAICAMYVYPRTRFLEFFRFPESYFSRGYHRIFRPKWLVDALSNRASYVRQYANLMLLIELVDFSDCDIRPEMIANSLQEHLFDYDHDTEKYRLIKTRFETHEKILSKYIWYFFDQNVPIAWADDHNGSAFTQTLIEYTNSGKIERQTLLNECLLTVSRPIDKRTMSWSYRLFSALTPTDKELTERQHHLMQALHCPHPKPQSQALKHLKYLARIGTLNVHDFVLESLSPLSSTTKSVVTATLAVFEQIAKTNPDAHSILCENVLTAILFRDEAVQTCVATFLVKYGNTDDDSLSASIIDYFPEVYSSVKTLFTPFISAKEVVLETVVEVEEKTNAQKIRQDNQITLPTDFDDQCFYLTQAFQSNTPWQFDGYLCVIRDVFAQINDTNLRRIESIWEQANVVAPNGDGRYAEVLIQKHFLTCAHELFPQLRDKPARLLEEDLSDLVGHSMHIFQARLDHCQRLLQGNANLPILSTPTHFPCFIAFNTFINRLNAYDNQLDCIDLTDFQIALSRLVIDEEAHVDNLIDSLSGELAELISYIVNGKINLMDDNTPPLWLSAIHYRGDVLALEEYGQRYKVAIDRWLSTLQWREKEAMFTLDWWQIQKAKDVDYDLNDNTDTAENITPSYNPYQQYFLDDLRFAGKFGSIPIFEESDFKKLLYTTPHDPTAFCVMAVLTQSGLSDTINIMESSAISVLNAFLDIWDTDFSEVVYLFYTCQILSAKKTVAQLASELWLQKVSENNMDSEQVGRILGKLEHDDYAPLKRFTDLVTAHLVNISTYHNQSLLTLLNAMIAEMHDTPIKGVKKLLELYLELLTVTKSTVPQEIEKKLATWARVKSLKAIIKKLTA